MRARISRAWLDEAKAFAALAARGARALAKVMLLGKKAVIKAWARTTAEEMAKRLRVRRFEENALERRRRGVVRAWVLAAAARRVTRTGVCRIQAVWRRRGRALFLTAWCGYVRAVRKSASAGLAAALGLWRDKAATVGGLDTTFHHDIIVRQNTFNS
jgi:hypothetical protein